jgi:hypothetical protein
LEFYSAIIITYLITELNLKLWAFFPTYLYGMEQPNQGISIYHLGT